MFRSSSRVNNEKIMTKVILVVFAIGLVAIAVQAAEVPAEFREPGKVARVKCMEETGTTEDMLEEALIGEFSEDESFRCYFKCILDQFSLLENDKIKYEAMMQMVPAAMKEKNTKAIEKCREANSGNDVCEKAFNFSKCLFLEDPEEWFVI